MTQTITNLDQSPPESSSRDEYIKFVLSTDLKHNLLKLANERDISLSALMRLIASDYLKRNQDSW